ncbi:phosphatases II [Dendrothele bispora CBS 962.96]|uniref:Phosphatases II n=1 Tax=Dendrothele bispora (strain CBS 962.96) TaxID=1314807 RepID=A0A4S8LBI9_DENBC|nr:phosphatases II [Dendrothele bispora CBS 962.96]
MLAFPLPIPPPVTTKVPKNVNSIRQASLIVPRVYISDYTTASSRDQLSELGITHVVSVLELDPVIPDSIPKENRLHISVLDRPDADILVHLERTTEFIKNALDAAAKNRVLVHCFQGISRSATVVCAYLIATLRMQAPDAIALVHSKREIVNPNLGFRQQLDAYSLRFIETRWKRQIASLSFKGVRDGFVQRVKRFSIVKES